MDSPLLSYFKVPNGSSDGGVFHEKGYKEAVFTFAMHKVTEPQWHQIFLRAIGANWLVCMAVYLSISAREIASKIFAIWWPTATFVALALDHGINALLPTL